MKKKVVKIDVAEYVAERGNFKGQKGKYVQLTLQNRGKNWIAQTNKNDDVLTITRPQTIVDTWLQFAEQIKAGKTIEEVMPTEFREIDNVFRVNVPLDGKYYRLYRKNVTDNTGKITHKKGDYYLNDNGKPQVYDSLNVLAVKYEDDDTGEMCWLQTPESIVRDLINRGYYEPVVANAVSVQAEAEPEGAASDESPVVETEPSEEDLRAELERLRAQAKNNG